MTRHKRYFRMYFHMVDMVVQEIVTMIAAMMQINFKELMDSICKTEEAALVSICSVHIACGIQ